MISKKKIVAIVLFILFSLFIFAFANIGNGPEGDELLPKITISDNNTYVMEVHTEIPEFNSNAISFEKENIDVEIKHNINRDIVGEYLVEFIATDVYGNTQTIKKKFNVVDTTRPVIRLIGESSYKRMLGYEVYEDEQARVTDNYDSTRIINGSVIGNASIVGTYSFNYTATDANGNIARPAVRTIKMIDPLADEDQDGYTNLEEYNNGTNYDDPDSHPTYDKAPTITLDLSNIYSIEVHSNIPEFKATAFDVADGNITVIITHNIDRHVVGTYNVTFTATDLLGNNKQEIKQFAVVDTTKPVITLIGDSSYKKILGYETYTDEKSNVTDNYDAPTTIDGVVNGDPLVLGTYTINYNHTDANGNIAEEVVRTIKMLDPNADEDQDGYTNLEEYQNNTDYDDPDSYPEDLPPILTIDPVSVTINRLDNYNVFTGLTVTDDFDMVALYADITDVSTLEVGNHTITYTTSADRQGQTAIPVTRQITVNENANDLLFNHITAELDKAVYDRLESGVLTVTAYDNYGEATVLNAGDYTVTPAFDTTTIGDKTISVSYTKDGTTSTIDINYEVVLSPSEIQVGIYAEIKPNVQLVFTRETPTTKNISDYIDVYNVYADSSKHLTTDYTTNFSTQTVGDDITLEITQNSYTFNDIKYTVKNEVVYQTKFNLSYNGSTEKPHCIVSCTTDYDFLEIREHFILPIIVKEVSIKYEGVASYEVVDNVEWRGLDDLFTSVRIGYYNDHDIMPPVIDKVSIKYEWLFRDYTIIFRYNSDTNTFDAISEY